MFESAIPSRPTQIEREEGSLDELQARTIRFETELSLEPPLEARWVVVIVRGDRRMDDALPFMPIQPLAFTNPVYLK